LLLDEALSPEAWTAFFIAGGSELLEKETSAVSIALLQPSKNLHTEAQHFLGWAGGK